MLSIVLIFFKESALGFIDFSIVFPLSISLVPALIFIISFTLLALGLVCPSFSLS